MIPRLLYALMASVVVGTSLFLTLGYALFVNAPTSEPVPSDAIVVLAGDSDERLPVAQELLEDSVAPVLALTTTGSPGNVASDRLCRTRMAEAPIVCYSPSHSNTRDEIRSLANVINEQGWDRITVVTSRYHAERANTLLDQCSPAEVDIVVSEPDFDTVEWLRRFVIEFGGLAQAYWNPACSPRL